MKILDYLQKHGISVLILLILLFVAIFISNAICMNQIAHILKAYDTTPLQAGEYQEFLIYYYQTQSDWINKWFTLLGILVAISGIAIPLLLNASYKEKLHELRKEAQKYKKLSIEQDIKIENLIEDFTKEYYEKLEEFEEEMKCAIEKAETDSILNKLQTLEEEAKRWDSKGNQNKEIGAYSQIISFGTKAVREFEHNQQFCKKVYNILENAHYMRGLNLKHSSETLSKAIMDFEQCRIYNKKLNMPDTPALKQCLLECYILDKQYDNAIKIATTITEIPREKLDGTHISKRYNFFEILKEDENNKATELLHILERIAKD